MDLNKIDELGRSENNVFPAKQTGQNGSGRQYTGTVDELDKMFASPSQLGEKREMYNARQAMKTMQENISRGVVAGGSKMPSIIRESVINNPLMVSEDANNDMEAFTGRLKESLTGIQRSMGIMEQVEQNDKKKQVQNSGDNIIDNVSKQSAPFDYELLKLVVENAVEKKIAGIADELRTSSPSLRVMKLTDKFLFLDDEDNVYECQMVFKGKNKHRKKK